MNKKFISSRFFKVIYFVVFLPYVVVAQDSSDDFQVARTSWGDPDLQGIYNTATITPFERPAELGEKAFYTPAEAAAIEAGYSADFAQQGGEGDTGTYNEFWYDAGTKLVPNLRTSLITDPPDGQLPAITDFAQAKLADRTLLLQESGTDGPEMRPLPERCMFWPSTGPPIFPTFYNNNYRIVQSPGVVAIHAEMIHDVRIIPVAERGTSEHLPEAITQWVGDSRGYWDEDTLVVETINFIDASKNELGPPGIRSIRGVGANNRVIEKFTPTANNLLMYEFTIEDDETFASPWTAEFALHASEGPIYEYACHEGNYAMRNVLMGARREEQEANED
jgi:hypothetical protein